MGINSVNGQDLPARLANVPEPAPAPPVSTAPAEAGGTAVARAASLPNQEQAQRSAKKTPEAPNPAIQTNRPRLRIDRESQTVIIQIVNEKDEVVKQIPPEDFLKNAETSRRIQGLLFDQRT